MSQYLFLFTLSPVQSFIEQARKAQDLYAGSQILSDLVKTAAKVAKEQGITLVFPTNTEGNSFPNRFVGVIEEAYTPTQLQAKGKIVEEEVQRAFEGMAKKALKYIQKEAPSGFKEQIEQHLSITWVFHEVKTTYQAAYRELDPLVAGLKNARLIANPNPEAGRKCSLDGERNALFFGKGTNKNYLSQGVMATKGAWLEQNEGLSAVSLIKRCYEKRSFPATAAVALQKQIDGLKENDKKVLDCYKKIFTENYPQACIELMQLEVIQGVHINPQNNEWRTDFDEQLLYEENLNEKTIPDTNQLEIARKVQKVLGSKLSQKYYAAIAFDADKMGKLLSGERCKPGTNLMDFQGKLSTALSIFSSWIYENMNGNDLHVIYAGGDDFLGFVCLENLFEAVKTLRIQFDEQVNKKIQPYLKDSDSFTFSMGIAIAHYKTPLHIVLDTVRRMEKKAKNEDEGNRDAVAIAVLKHSGESHEAFFKWNVENGQPKQWEAMKKMVRHFHSDCSDKFIRLLEKEFLQLEDAKGKVVNYAENKLTYAAQRHGIQYEEKLHANMMEAELLRLASRSLKPETKTTAAMLRDTAWHFFQTEDEKREGESSVATRNGFEALKIALFIERNIKTQDYGNQD